MGAAGDSTLSHFLWTTLRVALGYQWLAAGVSKVGEEAWMTTGQALHDFWLRALNASAGGQPVIIYRWYRSFIQLLLDSQSEVWFARVIALGEILVGVALVLGAFTSLAALTGAFLNFNYMLAGTAGPNPVLFVVAILILLAGARAWWYGADRYMLPWLRQLLRSWAPDWRRLLHRNG